MESVLSPNLISKKYVIKAILNNLLEIDDEIEQIIFLESNFGILNNIDDLLKEFEYCCIELPRIDQWRIYNKYVYFDIIYIAQINDKLINALINGNIKRLNLSYKLEYLDFDSIMKAICNNNTLEYLNLSNNQIDKTHMLIFLNYLITNTSLKCLDLSNMYFDGDEIICLSTVLAQNKTLQYLNLSGVIMISDFYKKYLLKGLSENRTLKYLSLVNNHVEIEDGTILYFIEFICKNPNLRYLQLSDGVVNDTINVLSYTLSSNNNVKYLDLSRNKISHENIQVIEDLSKNKNLISLNLSENNLDFSMKKILLENSNIRYLNLSNTNTSQKYDYLESSMYLRNIFQNNTIQHLKLLYCISHDYEIYEIAKSLKSNKTLLSLDISHYVYKFNEYPTNNIEYNDPIEELAEAILYNNTLQSLNLSFNTMFSHNMISIIESLKTNTGLQNLNLGNIKFSEEMGFMLASVLEINTTLLSLDLYHCEIPKNSFIAIIKSLKVNRSLQYLNLSSNNIDDDIIDQIIESVNKNLTLEYLNVSFTKKIFYIGNFNNNSLKYLQGAHNSDYLYIRKIDQNLDQNLEQKIEQMEDVKDFECFTKI